MTDLYTALSDFDDSQAKQVKTYSGLLGLPTSNKTVDVPDRNGYVYVRLRDNQSEIIQAFNEKVSAVYNLPVLVARQGNRWVIVSRDIERYENWGSYSAFVPAHAHQHEFNRNDLGGDIVFSYIDQIQPLLVYPSGTPGSPNVLVGAYSFKKTNNTWAYVGGTGTSSVLIYKPTNNQARIVLVYLDRATGNPGILVNSGTSFAANLTGTQDILQYLPSPTSTQEPLKAIRLVSGTTYVGWDNLYDIRQFFGGSTSGTGGGIEEAPIDSLVYGRKNAGWVEVSGTAGSSTNPGGSDTQVQVNKNDIFYGDAHFEFDYTNSVLMLGEDVTPPSSNRNEIHLMSSGTSPGLLMWSARSNSSIAPYIAGLRARNSFDAPQAIDQFDEIFRIRARGYNGTNWTATQGLVLFDAPYNWASGSHPVDIGLWGTPSGSSTLELYAKAVEYGMNVPSAKTYNINGSPIVDTGDWILVRELWTRASDFTFTTTASLKIGDKVRYKDGGANYDYGTVVYVSGSAPSTIGLATNTDFAMASANITDRYVSHAENPVGFPLEFNFNPQFTNITVGDGTLIAKFSIHRELVHGHVDFQLGGTSSVNGGVSFVLPVPVSSYSVPSTSRRTIGQAGILDAGTAVYTALVGVSASSTIGDIRVGNSSATYSQLTILSSTIPMTWASGDSLGFEFLYAM